MRIAAACGAICVAALGFLLLLAGSAAAHPLGELSVNHASALRVSPDAVRVLFVVDLAEVPSVPALSTLDSEGRAGYGASRCGSYAERLDLRVDGARAPLEVTGSTVFVLPGNAGLRTVRLECRLSTRGGVAPAGHRLDYTDRADPDRVGWREVTAIGDRTRLAGSTVPERSPSNTLARYPAGDPTRVTSASFDVREGGGPAPAAAATDPPRGGDAFAGMLGGSGLPAVLGVLLAAALGAGHALTPGHGKTLMALYLSGTRGSLRDAVVVGASVTATHTLGVFVLAVLVSASALTAPDSVYPWLGLVHGALIAMIGAALLVVRARRRNHGHGHGHSHGHGHGHGHGPERHGRVTGLVGFGIAGGLVPSPSALLVLLGAQATGRAAYGVVFVIAYGIGMAVCLSSVGWLLARGGRRLAGAGGRLGWVGRNLPVLAPSVIVCTGVFLAVRSIPQLAV
ncbi:MAG: High-affinity nickel-transporter [Actinophytocola sp.]|uniref:sulfite exporter TauE/SafE family protein n=1 Tax=Actinophytocola sp. TaxID=1872138 RepID=UPI0013219682|nr:sulfite exporter TauE/SafE family protein [Actinophytocola sp.]MPZ84410.1 High-affinity nickel-transporter [Actinophytocola sp.]